MRTKSDRIRHALSFEIIGLALITPLGAYAFGMHATDMGLVGLISATVATGWNYLYNLGFDHLMQKLRGSTLKTPLLRALHAVAFEAGLLVALLPFIAWYLEVSLGQALLMDVSFAIFYVVYALVFNWVYDLLFPLPEWRRSDTGPAGV